MNGMINSVFTISNVQQDPEVHNNNNFNPSDGQR